MLLPVVTGAISEGGAGAFEFVNPGWWGIAAEGRRRGLTTAAPSDNVVPLATVGCRNGSRYQR